MNRWKRSAESIVRSAAILIVDCCPMVTALSFLLNENVNAGCPFILWIIIHPTYSYSCTFTASQRARNWGWILQDNRLVSLMSTMDAAPDNLLKIIHGNCYTACKTLRCSCRRYGLPCTTVCGPCQIEECDSPSFLPEESEDDDE